ncbi:granule-bound starch synthase [Methylorubrum populi]|uniref:Granule-bound starch synthase n=1 Tax=Methylorubrum populi TaxID=223967 RepID=A0A160PK20_9HYPH|nr:hypothetical protein [Methylorubrum populi]BAU93335.1 granule-bound starch synthase [Methylorubrum populi]
MRTQKTTQLRESREADDEIASVDWKAAPHVVLEAVDRLLAEEGLEIVMLDTGSDQYEFIVEARR